MKVIKFIKDSTLEEILSTKELLDNTEINYIRLNEDILVMMELPNE